MGFFDHMLPAGIVPVEVRDALNSSCVLLSPPQRRMDGPTKSSGIFWNVFSVKGSPAGARRYEYPPPCCAKIHHPTSTFEPACQVAWGGIGASVLPAWPS